MRAQVNAITMAYDDLGQGEPVLLIHAFPLNRTMWAPQVAVLTEAGYRVIAPDVRGFGESEAPAGPFALDDLAADLLGLLDHRGVERAVVAGLSMGGYIAFRLLAQAPGRVGALVLADTRAGQDSPPAVATRLERAALAEREGVAPVAAAMLPGMVAGGQVDRADPALIARLQALMGTASPAGVAGALRAMAARPDSLPALAAITCPTLVLCGMEDVLTPPAEARLMAEGIPQARLALIEGAGHLANLEQPAAFNSALLDFLARRPGA